MPMPMEIPRLHSRDTTAPWNFGYIQWKIMLQIWFERIVYQSENQSEPPEPIWIPFLFHIQNLEDMLSKQFDVSVISPVQLWVLPHRVWWQQAGLEQAGLPRQPGRGSLTCDSKFKVELIIRWLSADQEYWDQDGGRWGPPLASSPHLTWGKIRVLSVQLRKVECCMILFH